MNRVLPRVLKGSTSRRNYIRGILNGVFSFLGFNLCHPDLVLSVFVRMLGGSNALIGLLPAVKFGTFLTPQFLAASWVQSRPRRVPVIVALEIGRVLVFAVLAALTYILGLAYPGPLLFVFFVLFICSRLTAGTAMLARMDVFGKVILPSQRVSLFANRSFWGGVAVFGGGLLVRYLLNPAHGHSFRFTFTLLFGLSSGFFLLGALVFARIKETPDVAQSPRHSLRDQLARTPKLLKQNPSFRRLLLARVLLTMTILAQPFYPIFALDILGAPPSMVGLYLSAMTLASILSNLLWQKIAPRRGIHFMVKTTSLLTALTPLMAVILPWLMRSVGFTVESHGLLPAYLFAGVFLLAGSSNSGRMTGFASLLLDVAPDEERASYIGLLNTSVGLVSFLAIPSGAIIDRVGFQPVFVIATGLPLLGFLVTLRLKPVDPGTRPEKPSDYWITARSAH